MEKLGNVTALSLTAPFKNYPKENFVFELTVKDKQINRERISYVFTVLLSHVKQALSVKNQIFLTLKYKVTSMLKEKNIALQQWNSSLYSSQGLKS